MKRTLAARSSEIVAILFLVGLAQIPRAAGQDVRVTHTVHARGRANRIELVRATYTGQISVAGKPIVQLDGIRIYGLTVSPDMRHCYFEITEEMRPGSARVSGESILSVQFPLAQNKGAVFAEIKVPVHFYKQNSMSLGARPVAEDQRNPMGISGTLFELGDTTSVNSSKTIDVQACKDCVVAQPVEDPMELSVCLPSSASGPPIYFESTQTNAGTMHGPGHHKLVHGEDRLMFHYYSANGDGRMVAGTHEIVFRFTIGGGASRRELLTKILVIIAPDGTSRLVILRKAPGDRRLPDPRKVPKYYGYWERVLS